MKRFVILISILAISVLGFAKEPVKAPDIQITAKGIVCSFCAQGLKKSFAKHPAVAKLQFDEEFNAMDLYLKPNAKLSDKEISKIVTEAGFLVDKIKRPTQ